MLDKVQNQAMRLITGAMKSTPIKVMEETTAISSLGHRRDMKISYKRRDTNVLQVIQ